MKRILIGVAILALCASAVPPAHAVLFTLTDANSVFKVDTSYAPTQWDVDGVYQLYQQGFWWRIGSTGGEDRLGNWFQSAVQPLPNILVVNYAHPAFQAQVIYTLSGGSAGSGTSDVAETVRIHANQALSFHLFQYADFDLGGTPGDDTLWFPNVNTVRQTDGSGVTLGETVTTPGATRHEGSFYNDLLTRLDNGINPTTLSDVPAIGGGSISGDVVWGYQWDLGLAPGQDFILSKDKHLSEVPEPATVFLVGLGLLGVEVARRRRNRA